LTGSPPALAARRHRNADVAAAGRTGLRGIGVGEIGRQRIALWQARSEPVGSSKACGGVRSQSVGYKGLRAGGPPAVVFCACGVTRSNEETLRLCRSRTKGSSASITRLPTLGAFFDLKLFSIDVSIQSTKRKNIFSMRCKFRIFPIRNPRPRGDAFSRQRIRRNGSPPEPSQKRQPCPKIWQTDSCPPPSDGPISTRLGCAENLHYARGLSRA